MEQRKVVLIGSALDEGAADYKQLDAEFYTKDRLSFVKPFENVEQKETM